MIYDTVNSVPEAMFLVGESEKHEVSIVESTFGRVTVDVDGGRVIEGRIFVSFSKTITIGEKEKHELQFRIPSSYNLECHVDGKIARPLSSTFFRQFPLSWQEIETFCEHLQRMGIDATVETREEKWLDKSLDRGWIKVANRNIDLVELKKWTEYHQGGGDVPDNDVLKHGCFFVVLASVEGLKDGLVAEGTPVRSWINLQVGEKVVDFVWKGKQLAETLNNDSILRNSLLSQRKPKAILISKEPFCIKISQKEGGSSALGNFLPEVFPTREAFEAYDRIAHHIRSIVSACS